MGLQTNQCCCCECSVPTLCCACVCKKLCAVITPTEDSKDPLGDPCKPRSLEMIWDEELERWAGSILGFTPDSAVDVIYYFEKEYDVCYLKLRSEYLGFPEGEERVWVMGNGYGEVSCKTMETEVSVPEIGTGSPQIEFCTGGTLNTYCAEKIKPTVCTGCKCACECLCGTYSSLECTRGFKACWDSSINGYVATIECQEYRTIDLVFYMVPNNSVCQEGTGGTGTSHTPHCDPDDFSCRLVMEVPATGYNTESDALEVSCDSDIGIAGTWKLSGSQIGTGSAGTGTGGSDGITITVRCAVCAEDCELKPLGCCPDYVPPETVFLTMEFTAYIYEGPPGGPPHLIDSMPHCAEYTIGMGITTTGEFSWAAPDYTNADNCYCADGGSMTIKDTMQIIASAFCGVSIDGFEGFLLSLFSRQNPNGTQPACGAITGGIQVFNTTYSCDPFFAMGGLGDRFSGHHPPIPIFGCQKPLGIAGWGCMCCAPPFIPGYVPSEPGWDIYWNVIARLIITE